MVVSRVDEITQKPFGPVELIWSLSKQGWDKLKFYESHLSEVV